MWHECASIQRLSAFGGQADRPLPGLHSAPVYEAEAGRSRRQSVGGVGGRTSGYGGANPILSPDRRCPRSVGQPQLRTTSNSPDRRCPQSVGQPHAAGARLCRARVANTRDLDRARACATRRQCAHRLRVAVREWMSQVRACGVGDEMRCRRRTTLSALCYLW